MTKKYLIETFGCQMNVLDSEKIAGDFKHHGMESTDDPSLADIIVLNTCSVRDKAVQRVYGHLGKIKERKKSRPDLIVCVVGCMAQLEKKLILTKAPFVNVLAGPQKGHVMSDLVQRSITSELPVIELRSDEDPSPLETEHILRPTPWRAGITISEGCNRRCAFCVVPIARGNERDRSISNILNEAETLVRNGCIEIQLLGQTVNSYKDPTDSTIRFPELLRCLCKIHELKRIRFTSPHPHDFSDDLLEVMVSSPQVCNHIHLPVQSGSTKILRAMRRGYTREDYLNIIHKIHQAERPIAISTDFIVGYPGESETDFQDTLSLMDEVQFDSAFSFKYSPRPNTPAFNLPDDVADEEKGRHLAILQERQKQIQYGINSLYVGRTVEVLVEEKAKSRVSLSGRTGNNKIVNFDGPDSLIGSIVQVEITRFSPNSLKGVLTQVNKSGWREHERD
jgi:tRNA-2-methylthio-N6-dimethylallyladenosine synthase